MIPIPLRVRYANLSHWISTQNLTVEMAEGPRAQQRTGLLRGNCHDY